MLDKYGILSNRWGVNYAKRSTKQTIHTRIQETGGRDHARRKTQLPGNRTQIELPSKRAAAWKRIYLEEGSEGFAAERRGRGSSDRPRKLPEEVEDLLAEVQRLRAENEYLKKLQALVLEDERRQRRKRR